MRKSIDEKSPGEDMPWNWDFSNEAVFATDPITSATFTDWDGNPLVSPPAPTVGAPAYSSPIVQTNISGGTISDTPYFIKCKATSAAGRDREAFLELYVRIPVKDLP